MKEFKMPKTKRGANRQANAIINKIYKSLDGGTQYGVDWPTARASFPKEIAHIEAMKSAYKNLPD